MVEINWAALLGRLGGGETLSASEAEQVLSAILAGGVDPAVISAVIVTLRNRGETVEELVGFARAMRSHMVEIEVEGEVVDTCGTGGDRKGTINVSTGAALTVAAFELNVVKHGGRAASSQAGSADVLEALGVRVDQGPDGVLEQLQVAHFGFAFAPKFHPAMAVVAPVRRALGIPTAFNFLGPLVNPARATIQLVGVFDPQYREPMAKVLAEMGSSRALVVTGKDGLDEISVSAPTECVLLDGDGSISEMTIDPTMFGFDPADPSELSGADARRNAEILTDILSGRDQGPRARLVALNAGATLWLAGRADSIKEGVEQAITALREGVPARVLSALQNR
jgi:anthranilate phosphoribosyltransferase